MKIKIPGAGIEHVPWYTNAFATPTPTAGAAFTFGHINQLITLNIKPDANGQRGSGALAPVVFFGCPFFLSCEINIVRQQIIP